LPTDFRSLPAEHREAVFHHGLRAALFVQAVVGSLLGIASAFVIPAFQFRLEAQRDAGTFAILAMAVTVLAALEAGLVAAWSVGRAESFTVPRVRRAALALAFALPVALTVGAVEARWWLLEHEDPLYGYVERGLARRLAQRGIGSEITLAMEEGRLTLAVPAWLERRGRWWVEIDARDTLGRRCNLNSAATFGDDPIVLRIPVPLASDEIPKRPFDLDPGSIVIVRGVRMTLDPAARVAGAPVVFTRQFERVYEAPSPRGNPRSTADFVGAPAQR
jgi:hypothetical protein